MKIRHEAPEPNMDWKVQAPLMLETPLGATVRIESWSLAGLVWPDGAPDCPKTGTLSVPFQGVDIRFPVRLASSDDTGFFTLEGMSDRQRETLALFYRSLLSGKMASSGEVITSLDTPVDLVPMEETEAEQSQRPVKYLPRSMRVLLNIATYLLIATMVVGIVGQNIFSNLDRIDIQHGRVHAPMSQSFPSQGGYVERVEVASGQAVKAGEALLRLRDPQLHLRLEQAEAELAAAEVAQLQLQAGLTDLAEQMGSEDIAMRMAVAARLYSAFISGGEFDEIRQQWISLRTHSRELAAAFDPLVIVSEILTSEAARRALELDSLRANRDAYLEMIDRNHIRAPSDGRVHDVLARPGQLFDEQAAGLTFESAAPRVTIGWVSEKFAETLFIGMPVTIGLNEFGKKVSLQGAIIDVRAADHPERPGEFGIMVTVTASDLTAAATKTRLRLGAPVNLEAKRQLGQRLRAWFAEKVS